MTKKNWINQLDLTQAKEIDELLFKPLRPAGQNIKGDFMRTIRSLLRFGSITRKDLNVARAKKIISTKG